eukprot:g6429.t1
MVIVRCNSSSDIVSLESKCTNSTQRNDQSQLIHMGFLRNHLFNNASILNAANASCTQLMLDDVKINRNYCSGKACISLLSDTILQDVGVYRNTNSTDSSVALCSVFRARDDSQIFATKLSASKNGLRILHIYNSTMRIRDSYFEENLNVNSSLRTSQFIQGGVMLANHSKVLINDSIFGGNFASTGGALFVNFTQLSITNCTFQQNNASTNRGGAIRCVHGCSFNIKSTTFIENVARNGGAMHADNSTISLTNCQFINNSAANVGASAFSAGAIVEIEGSLFDGNRADRGYVGAIMITSDSEIEINRSVFQNNKAKTNTGAVGVSWRSRILLRGSAFVNNSAEGEGAGGAIYVHSSSNATLLDLNFTQNRANSGGALYARTNAIVDVLHSRYQQNEAKSRGGSLYVSLSSNLNITESHFIRNYAVKEGGAVYLLDNCTVSISNTLLSKNRGYSGGAVHLSDSCNASISNCWLRDNEAGYNGGGVNSRTKITLKVLNSSIKGNKAMSGGALSVQNISTLTLVESKFADNRADLEGGCLSLTGLSNASVLSSSFSDSIAEEYGGALFVSKNSNLSASNINVTAQTNFRTVGNNAKLGGGALRINDKSIVLLTDSIVGNNSATTGGGVNVVSSILTVQNTKVSSNTGRKDCGGIRVHGSSSFLDASKLFLISNSADRNGGGICVVSRSSFLCYSCLFENNKASKGAGMYGSSKNRRSSIKAQLQDCTFRKNFATSTGGGLEFENPQGTETTCFRKKGFCGSIVLLKTSFIANSAEYSGSVVQVTNPGSILVSCDFDRSRQEDFIDQTSLVSLSPKDPNGQCNSWKRNRLLSKDSSTTIGTYGQRFNFSLINSTDGVQIIQDKESVLWLKNIQSGIQLPDIQMILLDGFGNGPAPTIPHVIRVSVESPETFFQGIITINLIAGRGVLSEVVGFVKPGDYSLRITPENSETLQETTLRIQVRDCVVGEAPTEDRVLCQKCGENSYNFDPNNEDGCTSCPETASCERNYIVPKDGYWHKGPCNSKVKRCVLEEACTYENRTKILTEFSIDFTDCSFSSATLIAYGQTQCSEGYEGTLCGSCAQSYGLSLGQRCSECPAAAESIITMIVLLLYLLVISLFTLRGALPYKPKRTRTPSRQSQREILVWNTTRSVAINIQMVEMMRDGYVPPDAIRPSTNTQRPSSNSQRQNQGELTGWKTAEIFKIMINFLQVTAAVGGIAVNWTDGIMSMFEATEYVGAITTVALSRPIDCIVSSDSALVRSVWRTLMTLLVPGIVIFIFIAYWGYIKIHKRRALSFLWKKALLSIIVVIYISYLGLTKLAVRVFHCVKVFDSESLVSSSWTWYWAVDTAIKCYGKEHSALISVGVIVLALVTLCFPFISALVITNYKDQRQNHESWINETMGFLYRAFKDRFMYWESIVMLRKACLSVIVVFSYPLGGRLQALLALLLLMLSLCLQTVCKPYRKEFRALNRYESASLFVSSVTLILGMFLDSERCSSTVKLSIVLIIAFVNVSTFCILLLAYLASGIDHMRAVLEEEGVQIPNEVRWWGVVKIVCLAKLSEWYKWAK